MTKLGDQAERRPWGRRRLVAIVVVALVVLAGLGGYLIWAFGWAWALVVAPVLILLVGFLAQLGGILTRGEKT